MKKNILFFIFFIFSAASGMANMVLPYGNFYKSPSFQTIPEEKVDINIFPNPVTEGRLTIKSSESFNLIQILNITGEIVFNQEYPSGSTAEVLELTKLGKGMYLVRIGFSDKPNFTGKIIVK